MKEKEEVEENEEEEEAVCGRVAVYSQVAKIKAITSLKLTVPLLQLLQNCYTILALPIEFEIMDGF